MLLMCEHFCQSVCRYLYSFDSLNIDSSILNLLAKLVLMYINMSELHNKLWCILYHQLHCLQVITVQDKVLIECKVKLHKESPPP